MAFVESILYIFQDARFRVDEWRQSTVHRDTPQRTFSGDRFSLHVYLVTNPLLKSKTPILDHAHAPVVVLSTPFVL